MSIDLAALDRLSPEKRAQAEAILEARRQLLEQNPLEGFHACERWCGSPDCPPPTERNPSGGRPKQFEFMVASELVVASNAGNRFGKTTGMVVWALIQVAPKELLPERLLVFRRPRGQLGESVSGRYMVPSEEFFEENVLPVFKRWTPLVLLRGGGWDKAYRKSPGLSITFAKDYGKLTVPTYKQDAEMLAGWSGDFVLWDEPPPEGHWREGGLIRVMDRKGCHRFGMTPVNMKGGGIGWVKRRIFDRGNPGKENYNPNFRIVRASIHDNPDYSLEQIEQTLSEYPEEEREAREHGTFLHFGGMVYPDWHKYEVDPPTAEQIRGRDVVVGIDPGYKTAAFVWVAFDQENKGLVFAEAYVRKGTAIDYAKTIRHVNARWGVENPLYVLDPYHGHKHGNTDGQTVSDELARQGIFTCNPTVIDKDAIVYGGIQQVWRRMREGAFHVSRDCNGLRGEAEEYRVEDRPDGVFQVVKERDDGLDAVRYAFTKRPWYPVGVDPEPSYRRDLDVAPPASWLRRRDDFLLI